MQERKGGNPRELTGKGGARIGRIAGMLMCLAIGPSIGAAEDYSNLIDLMVPQSSQLENITVGLKFGRPLGDAKLQSLRDVRDFHSMRMLIAILVTKMRRRDSSQLCRVIGRTNLHPAINSFIWTGLSYRLSESGSAIDCRSRILNILQVEDISREEYNAVWAAEIDREKTAIPSSSEFKPTYWHFIAATAFMSIYEPGTFVHEIGLRMGRSLDDLNFDEFSAWLQEHRHLKAIDIVNVVPASEGWADSGAPPPARQPPGIYSAARDMGVARGTIAVAVGPSMRPPEDGKIFNWCANDDRDDGVWKHGVRVVCWRLSSGSMRWVFISVLAEMDRKEAAIRRIEEIYRNIALRKIDCEPLCGSDVYLITTAW